MVFIGNGISDYGNYGLESYVCYKHISQLSPTYYSTITLTLSLDGSIFLPTLPNNLQMSLNEAEYYILQSPYPAALIIVHVLLALVKFDTQPKQPPLYFHLITGTSVRSKHRCQYCVFSLIHIPTNYCDSSVKYP